MKGFLALLVIIFLLCLGYLFSVLIAMLFIKLLIWGGATGVAGFSIWVGGLIIMLLGMILR